MEMSTFAAVAPEYPWPGRMKETSVSSERKLAVITNGSQGSSAALVARAMESPRARTPSAALPPSSEPTMDRHLPLALACALVLGVSTIPAARAEDAPIAHQIINALNKAYGLHHGFRANAAKGVVVEGRFIGRPQAARLSTSPLFRGQTIPITVRFSDSTGIPNIPDGDRQANPHGMAIKFHLPGGGESDMVLNSLRFFPVATGEEFRDLMLAVAASQPATPHPTPIQQFMAAHPAAPKALASAATPDSFADETYYGIDAFIFVDKSGKRQPVRYIAVPEKTVHLSTADAAKQAPDFLIQELPARLGKGPVVFHLKAQLAEPGDPTSDATKPWPDDRKVVDLGTITIDKAVPDSLATQKALLFLPGNVTDGIEPSGDPLIAVRNNSYAISFSRRQ
jgi:catalase